MECTDCGTSLQLGWVYCPVCGQKKQETLRTSEGRSLNSNGKNTQKKKDAIKKGRGKKNRRRRPTKIHNWCCYSCGYASSEESDEKYCPNCDCYISEYGMEEGETPVCNKCKDSDDVIPAGVRSKRYYCRKHGYSDTRCPADGCWDGCENRYAGAEYVCTYCKITVEKGCRCTEDDDDCHCEWEEEYYKPIKKRGKKRNKERGKSTDEDTKQWVDDLDLDFD